MKLARFDSAELLNIQIRCERNSLAVFEFVNEDSSPYDLQGDWQLFFKTSPEQRDVLRLNGTIEDNKLEFEFTEENTLIPQYTYYYELLNTTTGKTWLHGDAIAVKGKFKGKTDNKVIVSEEETLIQITVTAGEGISALTLSQVLTEGNNGGGLQIKNIADPTDDQDAATKKYVDDEIDALTAADVGAYPDNNPSNFVDAAGAAAAAPVQSVAAKTGAVTLEKADVGLGNVDNTSDLSKPVSTATQTALDLKANKSELELLETSGAEVSFDRARRYGYPTAITANITFSFTNAIEGMTQVMRHNHSSAPTLPASAKVLSGEYTTGVNNYIYFVCILKGDTKEVHVTISQEIV
jgi:hypothetical protein